MANVFDDEIVSIIEQSFAIIHQTGFGEVFFATLTSYSLRTKSCAMHFCLSFATTYQMELTQKTLNKLVLTLSTVLNCLFTTNWLKFPYKNSFICNSILSLNKFKKLHLNKNWISI